MLLELGEGVGAVVAYTSLARLHDEVEIGPAGHGGPRLHAAVRERPGRDGPVFAVVLCPVAPGVHELWAGDGTQLGSVAVAEGRVSELTIG